MLKVIIDDKFAMSGGRVFQQTVSIIMGTNCGSLLADFMQQILKEIKKKELVRSFNITFRCADVMLGFELTTVVG